MSKRPLITAENIHKYLHYDPETGAFHWINQNTKRIGRRLDYTCKDGYVIIDINGYVYSAHRLAWLYVHGYLPENWIDHINRNPSDNRIANLREASPQCNARNTGNPKNNTSGVKGVNQNESGSWTASIKVSGKSIYLGTFRNFREAVAMRYEAEKKHGWESCDPNSPAKQYLKKCGLLE